MSKNTHPDQSFDGRRTKFARNIYDSTKGKLRKRVLMRDIKEVLPKKQGWRILDAGGGMGQIACELAGLGHEVVLCDLSEEMLSAAKQHARSEGVEDFLRLIHSPIQELNREEIGEFDLVICHAVMEWVASPRHLLVILETCLKPGGLLSLAFYNYNGLLFHNLIVGNFDYIRRGNENTRRVKMTPHTPLRPEQVYQWLGELGLSIVLKSGGRSIHDYMRDLSHQTDKFEELLQMELEYSRQEPFISLGRYIHVISEKSP
jgi:S-adenosylmethionine-dependent methyltransferase